MTTEHRCGGGWGMASKLTVVALLALIAIGTNTVDAPVDRADLPLRVRIAQNIGDRISKIKSAAMWYTIGRFSEDEHPQALMQGPIDERLIDCEMPADGMIEGHPDDETFGDEFPQAMVIPRGEWQQWITSNQAAGFSLTLYNDTLNYQAPEHSCVSNATETAIRVVRNAQLGLAHRVKFSPMSLYCRVNSHRWGGSSMLKNLSESTSRGILPEDTPEQKLIFAHTAHQNAVYFPARELPDGWEQTAKHFRPLLAYRVLTAEQFASALLRGWPVVNGRSGHSICHLELIARDGRFLSKYADSYGTARGDGGYLYDSESKWATGGAWCLVSVTCPDDPAKPAGDRVTHWRETDATPTQPIVDLRSGGDAWDVGRYRRLGVGDLALAV